MPLAGGHLCEDSAKSHGAGWTLAGALGDADASVFSEGLGLFVWWCFTCFLFLCLCLEAVVWTSLLLFPLFTSWFIEVVKRVMAVAGSCIPVHDAASHAQSLRAQGGSNAGQAAVNVTSLPGFAE